MSALVELYQRFNDIDLQIRERFSSIVPAFTNNPLILIKTPLTQCESPHYPDQVFIDEVSSAQCFSFGDSGFIFLWTAPWLVYCESVGGGNSWQEVKNILFCTKNGLLMDKKEREILIYQKLMW
ncbi:hypothetical protein FERRO_13800 [Ferrovum sp. JA12]|uniref:hypothetical protein n=1 Tax=Ferrovum sp. JA12 TaxID=1356299 RepID=UPI0007032E73|nr:hypothetical protein [Ferrovum sp. JA12]KRH78393.1 hypothetical protein FERRO_13800 [Ferrovum sp. JA12]